MNESDLKKLKQFVRKAESLADCRIVKTGGLNTSFSIKFKDGQTTWESVEPDEEELRSMLLVLRQFVSPKEPIYIERIYNILELGVRDRGVKGKLRSARLAWKTGQRKSWLNMKHGHDKITPTYMADLWINGHYFHADERKEELLASLVGEEVILTRHVFLGYIAETVNQIMYIANGIQHCLAHDFLELE